MEYGLKKLVGILKKRIQTKPNEIHWLGANMSQAKVLNEKELKRVLAYLSTKKYGSRDRAMMLLTHYAGMRIGEVASLKIKNVLANDGTIKEEINLTAEQTKGKHSRTVILSEKMRKEILNYLQVRFRTQNLIPITYLDLEKPLFKTQKRDGFDANTACYHFHMLYKEIGLDGASSHSGRRGFLSTLSEKGIPLKVMMELAGHRQAQTTMRYVSVTPDMKRNAVNLL